jgi:hypothetical protein
MRITFRQNADEKNQTKPNSHTKINELINPPECGGKRDEMKKKSRGMGADERRDGGIIEFRRIHQRNTLAADWQGSPSDLTTSCHNPRVICSLSHPPVWWLLLLNQTDAGLLR